MRRRGKDNMEYAPIIIPTLNRAEHLKRCILSLANNTGAEFTEVYVSVDYPPNKKYEAGHSEVKKLLDGIDVSKFKNFQVLYQKKNLGPKENTAFLQKIVSERSDRYIFTEDDNEFAPNFLEYINKGLELFENNENVIGICGAKDTDWYSENKEVNYAKLFPAYGYGSWFSKECELRKKGESLLLNRNTLCTQIMMSLLKKNKYLFCAYVCDILCKNDGLFWEGEKLYWCDSVKSIYMHLTNAVCVVPVKAKSRTWGNDGTGVNMSATNINPEEEWPLDEKKNFTYKGYESLMFNSANYQVGDNYLSKIGSKKYLVKALAMYIILLISGKNRMRAIKIARCLGIN